ncbi:MAG: exo-alpha-sialidase, partial [Firmicutes bacterium]|nr:exo-alpha-sialidase [Bacillota bacterium]
MDIIKMVLRESLSCEAILRRAPDGDLIILSQCGGTNEPQKENRVVLLRSSDNGKTWSKPTKIYDDGRALYVSEVFVADGEIWAFALAHDGDFLGWETFLLKSFDSGYTWQKCESVWKDRAFCFIRGGIRVGDTLVFPTQYYEVPDAECRRLKEKGELLLRAEIPFVKNGALIS